MGSGFGAMGAHAATGASSVKGATTNRTPDRSEEAKQAAVLDAFESVVDLFGWDEAGGRWVRRGQRLPAHRAWPPAAAGVGPSARAAFFAHVSAHPITTAARPRHVRPHARRRHRHGRARSATTSARSSPPSSVLATTSTPSRRGARPARPTWLRPAPGPTRETLLLLAWAVALTDEDLGDGERALLDWFGRALYLPGRPDRGACGPSPPRKWPTG